MQITAAQRKVIKQITLYIALFAAIAVCAITVYYFIGKFSSSTTAASDNNSSSFSTTERTTDTSTIWPHMLRSNGTPTVQPVTTEINGILIYSSDEATSTTDQDGYNAETTSSPDISTTDININTSSVNSATSIQDNATMDMKKQFATPGPVSLSMPSMSTPPSSILTTGNTATKETASLTNLNQRGGSSGTKRTRRGRQCPKGYYFNENWFKRKCQPVVNESPLKVTTMTPRSSST